MRRPGTHTIAEWLAAPEARRLELVGGALVEKAAPEYPHALAQFGLHRQLGVAFHRRGGAEFPGGWWLVGEVDVRIGEDGVRPDLVGWRRDRVPAMPQERPITVRPDWVCETLSASNASNDTVVKLWHYHRAGIPHYWIVDPGTQTLSVYRNQPDGFMQVLVAGRSERVRAEPFAAIEIRVGLLLGDDPDDP